MRLTLLEGFRIVGSIGLNDVSCREHAFHFPKCPFVISPAETDNIPLTNDDELVTAVTASSSAAAISAAVSASSSGDTPSSPPPLASHGTAVWPTAAGSGLSSLVLQVEPKLIEAKSARRRTAAIPFRHSLGTRCRKGFV